MQGRWIDAIGPGGSKGGVSMRSTLECIFVVEGCCSRRASTGITPSRLIQAMAANRTVHVVSQLDWRPPRA